MPDAISRLVTEPPIREETTMFLSAYTFDGDRATFEAFHVSPEFRGALASAGLPRPRVEPLGEVHATTVGQEVRR